MSYTVLALKWRPKGFDEIVGQSHVVTNLKNAIEKNKLAHAYMFSGPRGVGKTSCARILAKALNCKKGTVAEPCGSCPSCLDITAGRSLDVIEIDGASNRGIDEIRTLRENVKFSPVSGRYKVYIIDEVHQITSDGFNALLKTLEEPPEFVKFILATTAPQKVPSTILSRCQRMDFRRISVLEISSQLEKIAAAEGGKLDKDVVFAIARASDGALRDAESILDQLLASVRESVSLEDVVTMLGNVQLDTLFQIADCVQAGDCSKVLSLVNDIIDKGKDASVLFQDLLGHFRNLMVARVCGPDTRLIDLPDELCGRLVKQAQGFSMEELFAGFNVLVDAQDLCRRMESVRIPLEMGLVRMCRKGYAAPSVSAAPAPAARPQQPVLSAVKTAPRIVETQKPYVKSAAAHPAPAPRPAAAVPAQPKMVPAQPKAAPAPEASAVEEPAPGREILIDEVRAGFEDVIREIAKSRMSVATYLREGRPEKVEGNLLSIVFPRSLQFHKEILEKKDHKGLLERCFAERFGMMLRVAFYLTDEAVRPTEKTQKDSAIKSAMDTFNGRLI